MISDSEREYLYNNFWSNREIDEVDKATTPSGNKQDIDLGSAAWQSTIQRRIEWARGMIAENGWSTFDVYLAVNAYYDTNSKRSIWDFLKAEYKPPNASDYDEMVRKTKEREIREGLYKVDIRKSREL